MMWIAGPICGATLQPYVAICSDLCRSRYGRRRPFIVSGALLTILFLLGFAWAENIGASVAEKIDFMPESSRRNLVALVAVFFAFAMNAAIQPLQFGLRALVVDACSGAQQDESSAWVARITTTSNILGYLAAAIDLRRWAPWSGYSQFQLLCIMSSISLAVTVLVTCLAGQEDTLSAMAPSMYGSQSVLHKLGLLYGAFPRLPKQLKRVCFVQFFAWMGWYPFQNYITL